MNLLLPWRIYEINYQVRDFNSTSQAVDADNQKAIRLEIAVVQ